jgi:hypothetical protein
VEATSTASKPPRAAHESPDADTDCLSPAARFALEESSMRNTERETSSSPTTDRSQPRVDTYERTSSTGRAELVFYNPDEPHQWINAAITHTVSLEAER